jgi:hypothetical protein
MSLVTWNGKLLLSPNGKLTLGPAADVCCCVGPPAANCDCYCDPMPTAMTAEIGTLSCTFAFTDSVDDPETKCAFSYRTSDPPVCFDDDYQINEVILECSHLPNSKWKVYVLADYALSSLGGVLELPEGACPPGGVYNVDLYNTSFAYVVTCVVTIP